MPIDTWMYNIPGLGRFYLFEMPVPGYAGYLPFGVICALVSTYLLEVLRADETDSGETI